MTEIETEPPDFELPRPVQVAAGIVLALLTVLVMSAVVWLIAAPNPKAPLLAPAIGLALSVGCVWVLGKCWRLITGRKRAGLLSPSGLRATGWVALMLPVAGLFTGYFRDHTVVALIQMAVYVALFFALRRLAAARERKMRATE